MTDQYISSISELSCLVESRFKENKETTVLYRGHGAESFALRPKVGRHTSPDNSNSVGGVDEELMLELFRRQSVDRISINADDWELLAIAQHHGLATRLLDWTRSPLVALYFAVCFEFETRSNETNSEGRPLREDAEIIVWRCQKIDLTKQLPQEGPLKIKETIRYVPRIVTPRLRAQAGVFTVHSQPTEIFLPEKFLPENVGECTRVRIPYMRRKPIKDSLFRHGVHEGILFPDVDGLARHIQWCQTKSY